MRHDCCPSTMTVENLADWIKANKVDQPSHIEKIPLTTDEINQLQRDIYLASTQIDKLKETQKFFTELIKKGTPWDSASEHHKPASVTVPPTKGIEKLESNIKFACLQLDNGFKEEVTQLYLIPWPEFEKMVALTIEGEEWTKYSRNMTEHEIRQHGKPILQASASASLQEHLDQAGLEIDKVNGLEATIKKKKVKKPLDLMADGAEEEKELDF